MVWGVGFEIFRDLEVLEVLEEVFVPLVFLPVDLPAL
jgi:hypothetical protein